MPTHLLLVEDNPGEALVVQSLLDSCHPGQYVAVNVATLKGAKAAVWQQTFDAVLLDLSLPDSRGLKTIGELAAAAPNLPIVVLTGSDDVTTALEAVNCGAQDYLVKGHADVAAIDQAIRYGIDRKQADETIRRSDAFLQTVINAMPEVMLVVDKDYRVVLANRAARETAGGFDAAAGLTCHQLSHHCNLPCVGPNDPCPLRQVIATKAAVTAMHTHCDATGKEGFVEVTAAPVLDEMGEVAYVVEACRDVTGRVCREQRIARLTALKEQLLGPAELPEKMKLITDAIVDVFGTDFARIWMLDEGDLCEKGCRHGPITEGPDVCRDRSRCLHLAASSGRYTAIDGSHRRVPLGCYKIGRIGSGEEAQFVTNDVVHDERIHDLQWAASLGLVSFAGYRLLAPNGAPLGVLALFSKRPIDVGEEALLEDLANTASQVIRAGGAEEMLHREKTFTDIVIDSIPGVFYVLDSQGRFVRWNRLLEDVTGLTAEMPRGSDALQTIFADDRQRVANKIREVFEKGQAEVEARLLGKDEVRDFSFTGRRMDVGPVSYLVGSGVDITDRKKAEETLRLTQFAVDHAADPICWVGPDARVVYANSKACEQLGYSREELLALKVHDFNPDFPAELWPEHWEDLKRRGSMIFESRHRTKEGRLFPVEITLNYLAFAGKEYDCSFARDISDRKRSEESLRRTAEELDRSNKDLEQFAYIVSHDLQEPLRTVSGFVRVLREKYGNRLDADANQCIEYAVGGTKQMQALVRDLLAYSRIGGGRLELAPTDARAPLQLALGNLQAAIRETAAAVTHGRLPIVRADAAQLAQLFQNLIGNALKFHGEAPPQVHVDATPDGGCWRFSVRDNGIGIDPGHQERIFLVFERLHGRQRYPGTGIGLAICKRILDRHGGRVWVESQPAHGATFYFTLPM